MARHRDVRNMGADDYEDDYDYGSSYGSSYCDEVPLSASVERQYMFRRNVSGNTPKISHFFGPQSPSPSGEGTRDEGAGGVSNSNNLDNEGPDSDDDEEDDSSGSSPSSGTTSRRHSSGSSLMASLTEEDQTKLAQCLEEILDVVGESMPEIQVMEAILRCDFDTELALNTLLNNPIGVYHTGLASATDIPGSGSGRSSRRNRDRRRLEPMPTPWSPPAPAQPVIPPQTQGYVEVFLPSTTDSKSDKDRQIEKTKGAQAEVLKISCKEPTSEAAPISKPKGNRLEIRSRTPSPAVTAGPTTSGLKTNVVAAPTVAALPSALLSSGPVSSSGQKMRKKVVDPIKLFEEERGKAGDGVKDLLNLVVVGHVDSGKSTLMGHVLFQLGQVSSKIMHKYEKESKKIGKASFAYAWVLDETSEERERGITMDVGHSSFETESRSITLLDAPGHKDFIPNMISGAYQADVAILVVNATRGEFEAGFDQGGQTREHALLVRGLGISQLIVAVNKLDTVGWSQERFQEISDKLGKFLKQQVKFRDADVAFVPVSGLTGVNLIKMESGSPGSAELSSWYKGPTLIEAIDGLKAPQRLIEKPFRMSISDVYKPVLMGGSSSGGSFCVAGRIETGFVQKNDVVLVAPRNAAMATVKNFTFDNALPGQLATAFAGDHVSLAITGVEPNSVVKGMVLCDPARPVKISSRFKARLAVLNVDVAITKGFTCVMHHVGVTWQVTLKKLLAQMDKSTGEVIKKKPRVLSKNCSADVEIVAETQLCLETFAESKELGRFMLRYNGTTIAPGIVLSIP